jgi:hypothetical protein
MIRWDELTRNSELIRAKHILFLMDACYGGLALTRGVQPGTTRFLNDMLLRYARQVLTAGKADEVVADSGGPLPNHSVFTGHLIEGLQGKAATEDGIITANGLMAYVHSKVATDINSNQTPHYGYFDGDGDFVLTPLSASQGEDDRKTVDRLLTLASGIEPALSENSTDKIRAVKSLLSSDGSSIELHDGVVRELRAFVAATGPENFDPNERFSDKALLDRLTRYEAASHDLSILLACIAYWGKSSHVVLLRKLLARATDHLEERSGLPAWSSLRWYPLVIAQYCVGIASVDGGRFDSLAAIFDAPVIRSRAGGPQLRFLDIISDAIGDIVSQGIFKKVPGHERHYVPMSEYLYSILQPRLDDVLFIGKSYEKSFDEFEIMLALCAADENVQRGRNPWGPVGRFGWKHRSYSSPFTAFVDAAKSSGQLWPPLQAGLFGGEFKRFEEIATEYSSMISRLHWH